MNSLSILDSLDARFSDTAYRSKTMNRGGRNLEYAEEYAEDLPLAEYGSSRRAPAKPRNTVYQNYSGAAASVLDYDSMRQQQQTAMTSLNRYGDPIPPPMTRQMVDQRQSRAEQKWGDEVGLPFDPYAPVQRRGGARGAGAVSNAALLQLQQREQEEEQRKAAQRARHSRSMLELEDQMMQLEEQIEVRKRNEDALRREVSRNTLMQEQSLQQAAAAQMMAARSLAQQQQRSRAQLEQPRMMRREELVADPPMALMRPSREQNYGREMMMQAERSQSPVMIRNLPMAQSRPTSVGNRVGGRGGMDRGEGMFQRGPMGGNQKGAGKRRMVPEVVDLMDDQEEDELDFEAEGFMGHNNSASAGMQREVLMGAPKRMNGGQSLKRPLQSRLGPGSDILPLSKPAPAEKSATVGLVGRLGATNNAPGAPVSAAGRLGGKQESVLKRVGSGAGQDVMSRVGSQSATKRLGSATGGDVMSRISKTVKSRLDLPASTNLRKRVGDQMNGGGMGMGAKRMNLGVRKPAPQLGDKKVICNSCPVVYEIEAFPCGQCESKFNSNYHLQTHLRNEHQTEQEFGCETCNAKFVTMNKYVRHLLDSHKICPVHYFCVECKGGFLMKNEASFVGHKKRIHSLNMSKKQVADETANSTNVLNLALGDNSQNEM